MMKSTLKNYYANGWVVNDVFKRLFGPRDRPNQVRKYKERK